MNSKLKKFLIIIFWVAVWAGIAAIVGHSIILAGPVDVIQSASQIIVKADFWLTIAYSFLHIAIGFFVACVLGCLFGILSYKFKTVYEFIHPLMQLMKSAPIVCFIVLLLVWFSEFYVDIVTVIIAVTPVFFFAIYESCNSRNQDTYNILKLYKVSPLLIWRIFEWPSALPYFNQAAKTGIGLSWKSAVTAQMIGAVAYTIGQGVYVSKLQLDSAQLLLWMFVVVILAWVCEKIILAVIKYLSKISKDKSFKIKQDFEVDKPCANLFVTDISKSYENKQVLDNFTFKFEAGKHYLISGHTGSGKTTLINIILGLIEPDHGEVFIDEYKPRTFSASFQVNTLIEHLTVNQNISIVSGKQYSSNLIDGNLFTKDLSGGMKRCAEIERAIISDSQIVILDEPFAGLDEKTKNEAIKFIQNRLNNRTLIIISHEEEDAKLLDCEIIKV